MRPATRGDLPALHAIAGRAVTELLSGLFTEAQIRSAAETRVYEVEAELVDAGTYYAAEIDGVVVGGSGWSPSGRLSPTPGAGHSAAAGTAAMRSSYVDPRWARRGIARLLARTTETVAILSGFRRFESLCTPLSAALRRSLGYELVRYQDVTLPGGPPTEFAVMAKQLPEPGVASQDR